VVEDLIAKYHLHPIVDHFAIALLTIGVAADIGGYSIAWLFGDRGFHSRQLATRLRETALLLLIVGALSAVLSRFTGESEAARLWDTISPAGRQILFADNGGSATFLSHAVLGAYLMYAFLGLAVWRVLIETWARIRKTQPVYLLLSLIALCGLAYQGKTGGELVYDYAVGTSQTNAALRPDSNTPR
jgi:uncharacterized membrane protein